MAKHDSEWAIYPKDMPVGHCSNTQCGDSIYCGDVCVHHSTLKDSWGCYYCGTKHADLWAGPYIQEHIDILRDAWEQGITPPVLKKGDDKVTLTFNLTTFPYRDGVPAIPTDIKTKIIDVRKTIRNPWRNPELRKLTGLDAKVQDYIKACKKSMVAIGKINSQAIHYCRNLYIGCQGGKHRSVAAAEIAAGMIREKYADSYDDINIVINITHLGLQKG